MQRINEEFAKQPNYKGPKKISPAARIVLRNYQWPGNVRELQNTLQRAALWTMSAIIERQDIIDSIIPITAPNNDYDLLNRPLGPNLKITEIIDEAARHYLRRALRKAGGNKSRAAKLIGLDNHQNFTNWMKRHNIEPDEV